MSGIVVSKMENGVGKVAIPQSLDYHCGHPRRGPDVILPSRDQQRDRQLTAAQDYPQRRRLVRAITVEIEILIRRGERQDVTVPDGDEGSGTTLSRSGNREDVAHHANGTGVGINCAIRLTEGRGECAVSSNRQCEAGTERDPVNRLGRVRLIREHILGGRPRAGELFRQNAGRISARKGEQQHKQRCGAITDLHDPLGSN